MYKVIFKGRDIEPLFLNEDKGKIVLEAYLANKPIRMVANNQAFSVSDIKNVALVEKSQSEQFAQKSTQQDADYDKFRRNMLSLPIEKRAAILRFPKIVWSANTQDEMPADVKEKIKERQLAYFTEHPKCIYANPACYRDLIPKSVEKGSKEGEFVKMSSVVGAGMMRFIENAISTDLELALKK